MNKYFTWKFYRLEKELFRRRKWSQTETTMCAMFTGYYYFIALTAQETYKPQTFNTKLTEHILLAFNAKIQMYSISAH